MWTSQRPAVGSSDWLGCVGGLARWRCIKVKPPNARSSEINVKHQKGNQDSSAELAEGVDNRRKLCWDGSRESEKNRRNPNKTTDKKKQTENTWSNLSALIGLTKKEMSDRRQSERERCSVVGITLH